MKLWPVSDGVTVPVKPCGTVQLYCPEVFEGKQLAPAPAVKLTPFSGAPLAVTVPLTWKVGTADPEAFPARSQVARPSVSENAIPLSVRPSSPTSAAGTSKRTHCPSAGSAPMRGQAGVLSPEFAQ